MISLEEEKMKIAISASQPNLDADVDPRFGRCQCFVIVELETMEFEGIENPNLYQLEGQVFDAKNDVESAIAAYVTSIESGNTTGQIHVLLGVSYTKVGRFNEAYQELNRARLRGYDDVVVKNNIAMIQMANGEYQQAIETLAPVLKEDPANKIVKSNSFMDRLPVTCPG